MDQARKSVVQRKRGRPKGKGRKPLSAIEKRARNAQYERERRVELAEASEKLAQAAAAVIGCNTNVLGTTELFRTVVDFIEKKSEENRGKEDLRERNEKLKIKLYSLWLEKYQVEPPFPCFLPTEDNVSRASTPQDVQAAHEERDQLLDDALEVMSSNVVASGPSSEVSDSSSSSPDELMVDEERDNQLTDALEVLSTHTSSSCSSVVGHDPYMASDEIPCSYQTYAYRPFDDKPLSMYAATSFSSGLSLVDVELRETVQRSSSSDWSDYAFLLREELADTTSIEYLLS